MPMTTPPRRTRRLPARVYWFRRALVLGVAGGLVVGVASLLDQPADPDAGVRAQPVGTTPTAGATPGPARATADAAQPRPDAVRGQRRPAASRTRTPLPEPSGPCVDSDVVVSPEVEGPAYAGSPVTIRLDVTTVESPACTWEVSPRTVAVKLASGSDRIWSSQDCPGAVPTLEVVARQQKPAVVEMTWRGQRSDSSCSRTTGWALPGWYHVEAAAFGSEPNGFRFELREPVPVTITPKPEKKKDRSAGR